MVLIFPVHGCYIQEAQVHTYANGGVGRVRPVGHLQMHVVQAQVVQAQVVQAQVEV
jgi:hypothetical protein